MTNLKSKLNTLNTLLVLFIFTLTVNTTFAQSLDNLSSSVYGIDVNSPSLASNFRFYNLNGAFLGSLQFQTSSSIGSGLTDPDNNFYIQHKPGDKTLFKISNDVKMMVFNDGKVTIGNVNAQNGPQVHKNGINGANFSGSDYKLIVQTGILTEKVKIAGLGADDWADYVFEEDYEMLPIEDLEDYVTENKHLPNVPSAQDVADNGLDLAKTDATLLEKIEESYLYIIELNKKFEALAAENNNLKSDMKALQTSQN